MADSKKYNGSQWEHSLRKQTTASEIIVPSTTIYADGTAISTYTIKGNTVQNGTPTPSNPVPVVGVGELETTGEHSGEYKVPILMAQTTPIYLGEEQTTRIIKKLVLTGNETVAGSAVTGGWIVTQLSDSINNTVGVQTAYCSHYVAKNNGAMSSLSQGEMCISTQVNNRINFVTAFATVEGFKAYLAAQYATGTPVTVWYVLTNATTGVVNEPLMKIGNYSDSISNATAIPTTDGANTVTIDTTVQPSEFTATWTGWHDSTVKEWDGSDWQ